MDVQTLLDKMTVEEKIGQLFLLAFSKGRIEEARILFEQHFVGASYISNDNVPTPQAALALTRTIQGYAANTRLHIPLLLGADQEGSWSVMTPGSCTGPGNMALGATADPTAAYRMYEVIGEELAAVGLNTLLAPCADCNSNPHNSIIGMRSFGEFPALVGAMTKAAVQGAHAGGLAVAVKHFPGHGDTTLDSHRGLPTVNRTRDELIRIDLHPFIEGIRAGAEIVMTAHIIFSALDAENPATLSPKILVDLLRSELGFTGVVLSDSMNMRSMKRSYDPQRSVVQAINAGVDLIMLAEEHYDHNASTYIDQQTALLRAVKEAVENGQLSMQRLDQAVGRVLRLKEARELLAGNLPEGSIAGIGSDAHRAVEMEVSRQAVALLRGEATALSLGHEARVVLVNTTLRASYATLNQTRGIGPNPDRSAFDYFEAAMREKFPQLRVITAEAFLAGEATFSPDEKIVAVTENYPLPGMDFDQHSQTQIISDLHSRIGSRLIVVALRDPYELATLPAITTYLCAFSFRPSAARAAAEALDGDYIPSGTTPVSAQMPA